MDKMKATGTARPVEKQESQASAYNGDHRQNVGDAPTGRAGLFRFSAALYLAALLFLFCVSPFLEQIANGDIVEGLLITIVLCTGVLAIARSRKNMVLASALALPALAGK